VVSYLYPLPIGRGQALLGHLNGVANSLIGGWGVNGITTFQMGFPLGFSTATNNLSTYTFQGTQRPDVVAGCAKPVDGSMFNRVSGYFNKSCFNLPPLFKFGNESRTDNQLRTPGIANWDLSLFKTIPIHESVALDFRVEAFNLFNRVQFASPNTQQGNTAFGTISSQANNPRIFQVSGRFSF
jgi:hypothetical protein